VLIEAVGRVEILAAGCALAMIAAKLHGVAHSGAANEWKKPLTAASWFLFRTLTLVTGDIPLHRSRWSKPVVGSIGANLPELFFCHWIGFAQYRHVFVVSRRVKVFGLVVECSALETADSLDAPGRAALVGFICEHYLLRKPSWRTAGKGRSCSQASGRKQDSNSSEPSPR
jgi:hypothetical protein